MIWAGTMENCLQNRALIYPLYVEYKRRVFRYLGHRRQNERSIQGGHNQNAEIT